MNFKITIQKIMALSWSLLLWGLKISLEKNVLLKTLSNTSTLMFLFKYLKGCTFKAIKPISSYFYEYESNFVIFKQHLIEINLKWWKIAEMQDRSKQNEFEDFENQNWLWQKERTHC